ncbi:protein SRC2-like [Salvia splendens]|uniref:protein SRC2-like n=1 Tax=Salvia splendens TaxID=180675 RepID=UPI001C25F5AD|nr:protein SRC2-like [Salvia splendens]
MVHPTLDITVQYAQDLNKVSLISKMDVYVVVSISGGDANPKQKTTTPINHGGGTNPTWSFPMNFAVEEAALMQNRLMLDFDIKCDKALGDRVIGGVHVPVKELLDIPAKGCAAKNFVTYQVKKPDGRPKGKLTFSYHFRPTTASPPPPDSTIAYPVVEPVKPYELMMATGGYSPSPPYLPAALGVYPQPEVCGGLNPPPPPPPSSDLPACGMIKPEVYPCLTPQGHFGHSPPMMQLAPDWWIADCRYETRCTGF